MNFRACKDSSFETDECILEYYYLYSFLCAITEKKIKCEIFIGDKMIDPFLRIEKLNDDKNDRRFFRESKKLDNHS